jgi:hypothetical protein
MGKTRLLSRENKKEVPVGSPTYYFSLVFSHLAGVYAPKILPFSDFANIRVGPFPAQVYLNRALWKLFWLALNSKFAEIILLFCWEKITPNFLIYSFWKTGEIYLKILPILMSGPSNCFHNYKYSLTISLFSSKKLLPVGQRFLKFRIDCSDLTVFYNSQTQLSLIPPTSCLMTANSLILLMISSFWSSLVSRVLALTFSLNINFISSLG